MAFCDFPEAFLLPVARGGVVGTCGRWRHLSDRNAKKLHFMGEALACS